MLNYNGMIAQQRDLRAQIEQCASKLAQLKEGKPVVFVLRFRTTWNLKSMLKIPERESETARLNALQESVSTLAQEQDLKQTQEADLLRRANELQNALNKRKQGKFFRITKHIMSGCSQ
jgi:hypothetical protein